MLRLLMAVRVIEAITTRRMRVSSIRGTRRNGGLVRIKPDGTEETLDTQLLNWLTCQKEKKLA